MTFLILIILFLLTAIIIALIYNHKHIKRAIFGGGAKKFIGGTKNSPLCDAINDHAAGIEEEERIPLNYVSGGAKPDSSIRSIASTRSSISSTSSSSKKFKARRNKIKRLRRNNKSNVEIFQTNAFPSIKSKIVTGKWIQYTSWSVMKRHKSAVSSYIKDKANILSNPDLDWSKVLSFVMPKLYDNYEYIGLVNIEHDNKTMYVSEIYKSDIKIGSIDSETTFASISSKLVEQVGRIPALFMFHTHPANIEACPLPSSQDLSTAIYYATNGHYAASMIVSRYGILLYGINDEMMKYFYTHNKKDFEMARANYTHDVVAAHESMRSWGSHKLKDYIDFYERYRMFLYIYPSSEFVAQHKSRTFDLLSPIDHEVIEIHKNDIDNIKNSKSFKFLTGRRKAVTF